MERAAWLSRVQRDLVRVQCVSRVQRGVVRVQRGLVRVQRGLLGCSVA
jgi:hypothetical protein